MVIFGNRYFCLFLLLLLPFAVLSQESDSTLPTTGKAYLEASSDRVQQLTGQLNRQRTKALQQLSRTEAKLYKKLARTDSAAAAVYQRTLQQHYQQLEQQLNNPSATLQHYLPDIDTLRSSLQFLQGQTGIDPARLQQAAGQVKGLETALQQNTQVTAFIKERTAAIKTTFQGQLQQSRYLRQLKQLNKTQHYYTTQLEEYKSLLKDRRKAEQKALALLRENKHFQDFMRKNSWLSQLFPTLPDNGEGTLNMASLAGLQTRSQVSTLLQQQITAAGSGGLERFQQNLQEAQQAMTTLQNQFVNKPHNGDEELPDFRPNHQKTKSWQQRLEYGVNVQNQRGTHFLPVTTDIGGSIGYKLNDRSVVGIGASYKLGWGESIRKLKLTHQGAGIRSFVDWQLKGSFWVSGGYELNWRPELRELPVGNIRYWQPSGLLGISKQVSLSSQFFKRTKVQLLWDFLSYQQVPRTQPILFRVGYGF